MRTESKALLDLTKIGATENCLFGEAVLNAKMQEVFELACKQGVASVAWRGIEIQYQNGVECCKPELKLQWYARCQQAAAAAKSYEQKATAFAEAVAPLRLAVLKGVDYAQYWPNPYWREFGDLDVIVVSGFKFFGERSGKADNQDSSLLNEKAAEIGCVVEDAGYKHSHINYKGLTVENHYFLTNFDGLSRGKSFEIQLREMLSTGDLEKMDGINLYSPSADFTALFMLVHAHRHFMMDGIELRHILDWFFFLKKENGIVDWKKVNKILEEQKLWNLAVLLTQFCKKHFDLRFDMGSSCSDELLAKFEDDLFADRYNIGDRSAGNLARRVANRFCRMWRFRVVNNVSFLTSVWLTFSYSSFLKRKPELN